MAAELANHKIVIVEDEGLIAADLEQRLSQAGYAVPGTADSAPKALQLVRQTLPDLVLMDIHLKGNVDGIQVADQIRRQLDIPVVYLTAYEDGGTLERAGQSQAFGYIKKPVASAGLKGAIEVALAKHRYERHLREQRDWAIASFASLPDAVFVTDNQGRINYLNARAEALTGLTSDAALRLPCWESLGLFYRHSGELVQDFIPVAMLNGESVSLPGGICHTRAARTLVISGTVAPRWRNGAIAGTVIMLSDITRSVFESEQKQQDNKQKALQRLAESLVRELRESAQISEEKFSTIGSPPGDLAKITTRLSRFLETPAAQPEHIDVRRLLRSLQTAWRRIQPALEVAFEIESAEVEVDFWQLMRAVVNILLHARTRRKNESPLLIVLSEPRWDRLPMRCVFEFPIKRTRIRQHSNNYLSQHLRGTHTIYMMPTR